MKFVTINNISNADNPIHLDSPLLIQVEYNSNGKYKLSQAYGLDLVRELRLNKKCTQPIILYSPLSKAYLKKKFINNHLKVNPFNDPSVTFFRQPIDLKKFKTTLKKMVPLTAAGLADVNEMLYKRSGFIIDKLTHEIKFEVPVAESTDPILSLFDKKEKDDLELETRFRRLQIAQEEGQKPIFVGEKLGLIQMFSKYFKIDLKSDEEDNNNEKITRHAILVVEDDEKFAKVLTSKLGEHFDVKFFRDSRKAITFLNKDKENRILGVLSDWRLFEKKSKKWQARQGYDILSESAVSGFRVRFALTSLFDENIENIRKKLPVKFDLVRKDYLLNTTDWTKLITEIHSGCSKILNVISSLPESSDWKAHYNSKYLLARSKSDWHSYEQMITNESNIILNRVKSITKNETIYYNTDLSFTLPNDGSPSSSYDLKTILILRRVTFAYWYTLRASHRSLDRSNKTKLRQEVGRKFIGQTAKDSSIGKYFKQICIQTNTIESRGTLPEETAWLESHKLI